MKIAPSDHQKATLESASRIRFHVSCPTANGGEENKEFTELDLAAKHYKKRVTAARSTNSKVVGLHSISFSCDDADGEYVSEIIRYDNVIA